MNAMTCQCEECKTWREKVNKGVQQRTGPRMVHAGRTLGERNGRESVAAAWKDTHPDEGWGEGDGADGQ